MSSFLGGPPRGDVERLAGHRHDLLGTLDAQDIVADRTRTWRRSMERNPGSGPRPGGGPACTRTRSAARSVPPPPRTAGPRRGSTPSSGPSGMPIAQDRQAVLLPARADLRAARRLRSRSGTCPASLARCSCDGGSMRIQPTVGSSSSTMNSLTVSLRFVTPSRSSVCASGGRTRRRGLDGDRRVADLGRSRRLFLLAWGGPRADRWCGPSGGSGSPELRRRLARTPGRRFRRPAHTRSALVVDHASPSLGFGRTIRGHGAGPLDIRPAQGIVDLESSSRLETT